MRNIKLTLEYDGAEFFGFQKQKGKRTVQSELEKAFKRLFRREIKIASASGRTDSGVHAKGQVVHLKVDSKIPLKKIQQALNTYLHDDLAVVRIAEMPPDFHARFWAKSKTYQYIVWNSRIRPVLEKKFTYHYPKQIRIPLMKEAAKCLIGKHDFRSFQAKADGRNSIRTIYHFDIRKRGYKVHFVIEANGFLYNMVRNIIGTLLRVGEGQISVKEFKEIVARRSRDHIGHTVPPQGLTLLQVKY